MATLGEAEKETAAEAQPDSVAKGECAHDLCSGLCIRRPLPLASPVKVPVLRANVMAREVID